MKEKDSKIQSAQIVQDAGKLARCWVRGTLARLCGPGSDERRRSSVCHDFVLPPVTFKRRMSSIDKNWLLVSIKPRTRVEPMVEALTDFFFFFSCSRHRHNIQELAVLLLIILLFPVCARWCPCLPGVPRKTLICPNLARAHVTMLASATNLSRAADTCLSPPTMSVRHICWRCDGDGSVVHLYRSTVLIVVLYL